MSDNNKDLLVSIPTRSRPGQLQRTLEMLYSTCAGHNNFIIQVIIDSDQIDLYRYVIDMFPKWIEWTFVEHLENSFSNIYEAQRALLTLTQSYFFMNFCDDIYGEARNVLCSYTYEDIKNDFMSSSHGRKLAQTPGASVR